MMVGFFSSFFFFLSLLETRIACCELKSGEEKGKKKPGERQTEEEERIEHHQKKETHFCGRFTSFKWNSFLLLVLSFLLFFLSFSLPLSAILWRVKRVLKKREQIVYSLMGGEQQCDNSYLSSNLIPNVLEPFSEHFFQFPSSPFLLLLLSISLTPGSIF